MMNSLTASTSNSANTARLPLDPWKSAKGVSISSIAKVFFLYIPRLLGYTLPTACLITIMLAFGRLSADNEIVAMRANGIYLKSLLFPLLILSLILSLFSIILNGTIIPNAHHEQRKLLKDVGTKNPAALLKAGTFINDFENQILFIYRIDGNKLYNVRIYQPQPDGKPTRTIIAKEGEFASVPGTDKIMLKLINGTSDEPNLTDPDKFYKLNFQTFFRTLNLSQNNEKIQKKLKSMSFKELMSEINKLSELFIDASPAIGEYHRKLAWSFSPLIFILLGFPIAVITHKKEKTANVVLAMLFALSYYLISLGCEALSSQHISPPAITMWVPNIIGGITAITLNYKLCTS